MTDNIYLYDFSFSTTAVENLLDTKPTVHSLKCPVTAKRYLNKYFEKWNDLSVAECYSLPFCTNYNSASYKTEKCLYDYLCALKEPMLIANGYQHNTKSKRNLQTGICGSEECATVDETDILLVHRDYGLLLFEVKDMREIIKLKSESLSKAKRIRLKQDEVHDRCPLEMIAKAEKQLNGPQEQKENGKIKYSRWEQIKKYLKSYFADEQVKKNWQNYWAINDIDQVLEHIISETSK